MFQVFLLYFMYLGCYFISRSLLELEKLFQSSEKHVWHHPKVKSVTWAGKHGPVLETQMHVCSEPYKVKENLKARFFLPLKRLVSNFSVISIDQMITGVVFQIIL